MQTSYRSVFISDVHLGTQACQAQHLIDFLQSITTKKLYLVGDIVDLLEMKKKAHFPETHRQVMSEIMRMAREGTDVIYIPGNHDDFFRQMIGQVFAGIKIQRNAIHVTADGRRFFVSHGDEFDQVVTISPLLCLVGDKAHAVALRLNIWCNAIRRCFKMPYWSFAGFLKRHIGKANQFIRRFEYAALKACKGLGVDGYICGHIHSAAFRMHGGKLYCNDGDWVEHCTALIETESGELNILHWSENPHWVASEVQEEMDWVGETIS